MLFLYLLVTDNHLASGLCYSYFGTNIHKIIGYFSSVVHSTEAAYQAIIDLCKDLFLKKAADYGMSWHVLRLASTTDQVFIKAKRIRTLEEAKHAKVDNSIIEEYMGIVNYCIIALIQLADTMESSAQASIEVVSKQFDQQVMEAKALMRTKNHDYGEAWKSMRRSSLTDLILMKLLRIKQIEDNQGFTQVSEGVQTNYQDILNYAVFALIKLGVHEN